MKESVSSTTADLITTAKLGGAATTAGIGLAQTLELIQSGLAIVASIVGIIATSWIIYDKYREYRARKKKEAGE